MYKQLASIYYNVGYILGKHFVLKMFLYFFSQWENVLVDCKGNEGGGSNQIYEEHYKAG